MARTAISNAEAGGSVRGKLNLLFCNSAAANPGVNDDSGAGFGVGSPWYNSTTGTYWLCCDATAGAAVWQKLAASAFPGYRAGGVWYDLWDDLSYAAGISSLNSRLLLLPFQIKEQMSLSALGVNISTLSASGNVMVAIYANNPATIRPTGNPVAALIGLSSAATGFVSGVLSSAVSLTPGTWWAASQADNSTCRVLSHSQSSQAQAASRLGSTTLSANLTSGSAAQLSLGVANSYGTFPDLTSATFAESNDNGRLARLFGKTQ